MLNSEKPKSPDPVLPVPQTGAMARAAAGGSRPALSQHHFAPAKRFRSSRGPSPQLQNFRRHASDWPRLAKPALDRFDFRVEEAALFGFDPQTNVSAQSMAALAFDLLSGIQAREGAGILQVGS